MDYQLMHEKIIYPMVQVRAEAAGGSGTVIYSEKQDGGDAYDTYVSTNWHVVAKSISVKDKYQSIYGRNLPWEERAPVEVRSYIYSDVSFLESTRSSQADIVAWDKDHDLALLHLRTRRQYEYVADLFEADRVRN